MSEPTKTKFTQSTHQAEGKGNTKFTQLAPQADVKGVSEQHKDKLTQAERDRQVQEKQVKPETIGQMQQHGQIGQARENKGQIGNIAQTHEKGLVGDIPHQPEKGHEKQKGKQQRPGQQPPATKDIAGKGHENVKETRPGMAHQERVGQESLGQEKERIGQKEERSNLGVGQERGLPGHVGQHERVGQEKEHDLGLGQMHIGGQEKKGLGHERVGQEKELGLGQHERVGQEKERGIGQHERVGQEKERGIGQHERVGQEKEHGVGQHERVGHEKGQKERVGQEKELGLGQEKKGLGQEKKGLGQEKEHVKGQEKEHGKGQKQRGKQEQEREGQQDKGLTERLGETLNIGGESKDTDTGKEKGLTERIGEVLNAGGQRIGEVLNAGGQRIGEALNIVSPQDKDTSEEKDDKSIGQQSKLQQGMEHGGVRQEQGLRQADTLRHGRRGQTDENLPHRYLVLIDGSDHADKAFQNVIRIKKDHDKLLLCYVCIFSDTGVALASLADNDATARHQRNVTQQGQQVLDDYMRRCSDQKIANCETLLLQSGKGKDEVIEFVEANNIDTVFVGHRGVGKVHQMLIGSFSQYMAEHCPCNVMLVKCC